MSIKNKKNQKITDNNIESWKDPVIRRKRINGIKFHYWNDIDQHEYYQNRIKPLIWDGMTFIQMYKTGSVDKSAPTLKKITMLFGSTGDIIKSQENVKHGKAKGGNAHKGKPSPLKGKTYEEILGSIDKAKQRSQITSKWMKTNNIRRFTQKISKPQKMLFEIIKKSYPNPKLEYEIQTPDGRTLWLDIALVDEKINIEYDGMYWHDKNNKKHTKKSKWTDIERDEYLKSIGWTIYRFQFCHNPKEKELVDMAEKYNIIK